MHNLGISPHEVGHVIILASNTGVDSVTFKKHLYEARDFAKKLIMDADKSINLTHDEVTIYELRDDKEQITANLLNTNDAEGWEVERNAEARKAAEANRATVKETNLKVVRLDEKE
jgi:hypothetical protein